MQRKARAAALLAGLLLAGAASAYVPDAQAPVPADPPPDGAMKIDPTVGDKTDLPTNGITDDGDDGPADPTGGAGEPRPGLGNQDPHAPDGQATSVPAPARIGIDAVRYGETDLPAAVRETRNLLLEAARTGDIEALRPVFARQSAPPIVAGFDPVDDPVGNLKLQSGDDEGREILAILIELLESGYVRVGPAEAGTYVWPYFAEVPLDELSDRNYVELYRILTAVDVEEIARQGRYTFFRVGIAADGRVRYFSAGDLE